MRKSVLTLIVGIVLLIASMGIMALSTSGGTMEPKMLSLEPNEEKEIRYTLEEGNYTLLIQTSEMVHYELSNSSKILEEGNFSSQLTLFLQNLHGDYILKIKNMGNSTANIVIVFESESKMVWIGWMILGSGSMCLIGIIIIIVGIFLIYKEKKKEE